MAGDERTPIAEQVVVEEPQVEEVVVEAPEVDEAAEKEAKRETEARAGGWVPLEEWRGDPDEHVSAKEFIRFGRAMEPLKRKLHEAEERNGKLIKDVLTVKQQIEAEAKAKMEAEIARLNGVKKDAFERADFNTYQAAEDQTVKLRQEAVRAPEPAANAIFTEWQGKNTWYSDPTARQEADLRGREILIGITGGARDATDFEYKYMLDKVAEEVGSKHAPPRQVAPPPVNPARPTIISGGKPKQNTFNSLPEDAKEAFLRFQRQGIYKNTGDNEKDAAPYVRDYNSASTSYTIRSN